jgi:glycosyltransferase involved in cell wall biosynthesis
VEIVRVINILLDGWGLVYEPQGSAALHLMTLLATKPAGVHYMVALPGSPPEWMPQDIKIASRPAADTAWGRLSWEQRVLPAIARQSAADLLHLVTQTPPLSIPIPVVVSPSDVKVKGNAGGPISRLRDAFAAGGMSRLSAIFLPDDMPNPEQDTRVYTLPPVVHPGFIPEERSDIDLSMNAALPDTYVLYPDALEQLSLVRLLDAWSWAHSSLGDYYPLLFTGLSGSERKEIEVSVSKFGLTDGLQVFTVSSPLALPYLYRQSTAVFQMGSIPAWGNSARNALASGKPYVASASPQVEAIVGPAAYLAPAEDERGLGAALITVIVEESVTEQLSQAARKRSSAWEAESFSATLGEAYQEILSP